MRTLQCIFSLRLPLFWSHACLVFAGFSGLAFATFAASAAVPDMVTQKVSAHVWYVEGLSALGSPANQNFISNAAFIVTPAGVVVVDSLGSPALASRLMAEIRKVTDQPVTHVIVTHYHADHVYGLQTFKAAGARILAEIAGRESMSSETALKRLQDSRQTLAPWVDDKTRLVPADEWIDRPTTLTVGGVKIDIQPVISRFFN